MKEGKPEKPQTSPQTSFFSKTTIENAKKVFFGDQFDVTKIASNFAGIATTTVASLPLSSPALNTLNRMHYLSKDHPWIKYRDVIQDIYTKEGLKGFYEQSGQNAKRRVGGLGFGFCLSEALGEQYKLNPIEKSSVAALSEAAVSLAFGEINERRKTARADNTPPQYTKAITSLVLRNMMFASSVYSDKIVDNFMENSGDDIARQIGCSAKTVRACASLCTKVVLLSSTMPLDKAATKFSIGHNPISEYIKNPRMAFKGTASRVIYALIVGQTVSQGIKFGESIYEKLNSDQPKGRP